MESQRKHFSSLSAFTDVAISINIPSCNLSVTFLESIFLQEKVVGCNIELFSACPFPQQDLGNMSEQQLRAVTAGKEGAGVPADRGQAAAGRCLEGKRGFPLDDINVFFTHADVGKCSSEWKGHCNSSAAGSASVCLAKQHRVFPMNLPLWSVSQRLVRHKVCWAAAQVKFKSCLSLNWYLGLSWAATRDDVAAPFGLFCLSNDTAFCSSGLSMSPLCVGWLLLDRENREGVGKRNYSLTGSSASDLEREISLSSTIELLMLHIVPVKSYKRKRGLSSTESWL